MKNNYIAVQIEEGGKYYAYAVRVAPGDNLLSKLKIPGLIAANICPTKKRAVELVNLWREAYHNNGNAMFPELFRALPGVRSC